MSRPSSDRPWAVQEIEGKGRGVVSTREIPGGSVVLLECAPLIAVVDASRTQQTCRQCFALRYGPTSTMFRPQHILCQTCKQVAWCCEECKKETEKAGTHTPLLCLAYQRLSGLAAVARAESSVNKDGCELDDEMHTDARFLMHAYDARRNKPQDWSRWHELCSAEEPTGAGSNNAAGSSSSPSTSSASSSSSPSAEQVELEKRIELLHDTVVKCLEYAAEQLGTGNAVSPPDNTAAADDGLSLPSLSKQLTDVQFTDSSILPSPPSSTPLATSADLPVSRALYLRLKANGFALMAPNTKTGERQTPRGYAVYSQAAMFNHSCMPNITRFDEMGKRDEKFTKGAADASSSAPSSSASSSCSSSSSPLSMELRALHSIPPYTELTLSYVPLFWSRSLRREQLALEYGFKCRCGRCRCEKQEWKEEQKRRMEGGEDNEDDGEDDDEHEHDHDDDDDEEDEDEDECGEDDEEEGEAVSDDDEEDVRLSSIDPAPARGELNVWQFKYICPSKICGGGMAPLRQDSKNDADADAASASAAAGPTMECNMCGKVRTDAQFHRQLAKEFGLRS